MARFTFVRQDAAQRSDVFDDTIAPTEAAFETNPVTLEDDLNNVRSMLSELRDNQAGDWFTALAAATGFESGAIRGVQDNNQSLHNLERARRLRKVKLLVDVATGAGDAVVILGSGELPTQTTAAVGAVTTLGTVVAAHGGTFGNHALTEVAGSHALAPKNLLEITDETGDPILSSGKRVWGLLQSENASDGFTITDTTPDRVQISFVITNGAHNDLIICPFADIENLTIRYCYVERVSNINQTEQDFMSQGAAIDIGAGSSTVTRQLAYDNQGSTPVDQITSAILDLEGAGLTWEIRDDLEAVLFRVFEGSASGTSRVDITADVDTFDVDAAVNDFLNGASFDTGAAGTTIDIGVTLANNITSGALLRLLSTSADLSLASGDELNLTDTYRAGSTWSLVDGVRLAAASATWSTFETNFGESAGIMDAINTAFTSANFNKTVAVVSTTTTADTDVGGVAGGANLDVQIHDLSGGSFILDHDIFLNGQLLRNGADASANFDVYPGTSLPNGQLRFEFTVTAGTNADVITVISRA